MNRNVFSVLGPTKPAEKGLTVSLDEAMTLTGCGIYNVLILLLSGLVLMGMITETLGLGYIIPVAHCDLKLALVDKGWLAAIPFVGIIITSHAWGWAADTKGRRPVMLGSMAACVVFSVLSSFAPNLWSFALLRFLSSLFVSGPSAVCYAYLGEFMSIRHRDKMVAFGASFVGIGTTVLPAMAWLIMPLDLDYEIPWLGIEYRSWRLMVAACAIPFAFCVVGLYFAPESPKFLQARGRSSEALDVVKSIYAVNKAQPEETFPVVQLLREGPSSGHTEAETQKLSVLQSMAEQTLPLFRPPLVFFTAVACFVQFGIFATANGYTVWLPDILNRLSAHSGSEAGGSVLTLCNILSPKHSVLHNNETGNQTLCNDSVNTATYFKSLMMGLVFCTAYLVAGLVIDFVGKKNILVVVLFVSGSCGIATYWVTNQTAIVALFGVFLMCGSCIGMMNAVVVALYPTHLRAMAVCLSLMMGRVGSVLGSNVIGLLIEVHCPSSFFVFGGLLIVCSLLCLSLPNMRSPKKDSEAPGPAQLYR